MKVQDNDFHLLNKEYLRLYLLSLRFLSLLYRLLCEFELHSFSFILLEIYFPRRELRCIENIDSTIVEIALSIHERFVHNSL